MIICLLGLHKYMWWFDLNGLSSVHICKKCSKKTVKTLPTPKKYYRT